MLPAVTKADLAQHLRGCGPNTRAISPRAPAGWSCRRRWQGSIRTRATSGSGSGCSRHQVLSGWGHRPAPPPSSARDGLAAGGEARGPSGGNGQAREPSHPPSLVRDASARGTATISARSRAAGHRNVSTTMIYTHVLNRGPAAVRSPADRMFRCDTPSLRLRQSLPTYAAWVCSLSRSRVSQHIGANGREQRAKAQTSPEHDAG